MAMPQPPLRPGIGFCLQTESLGSPPARWFVNITKHKLVDLPLAYSGKRVDKEWILTKGLGCLQVPFDMGSFRKLKERAEGKRHTTYVVDVCFNPLIVQLFMDDDFCTKLDQYRQWVTNLALNRIDESLGVKLSSPKVKLVKSARYKDGEDGDSSVAREFMELPGEVDIEDDEPQAPQKTEEPLIQEVTTGTRTKPALKKGFLNSKAGYAAGSLYGESGSTEGVVPENAGDPLGYLPKKLRNSAKIIDCNSPEYQAQEKEKKRIADSNNQTKQFHDEIMSGFNNLNKGHDKWEEDRPDGNEAPLKKYDNDYARFDRIEDEEEGSKEPERDWYVDSKGQHRTIGKQPEATGSPTAQPEVSPAVKKGFLDGAKGSIYGDAGSKEASAKGPKSEEELMMSLASKRTGQNDEADLMRQMQSMMGGKGPDMDMLAEAADMNEEDQEQMKHLGNLLRSQEPSNAAAKTVEPSKPEFTLSEADGNLILVVKTPGLTSMNGVDLDVTERNASLDFPRGVRLRPLKVELPEAVEPTAVKAKFSKKTQQITITLPRSN